MSEEVIENKSKPTANPQRTTQRQNGGRRNSRRQEFIQTRKSVPHVLHIQSNTMLHYMERSGGAAAGAFQRVAGLIQLTSSNKEVRERLNKWFEEVVNAAKKTTLYLSSQQENYSKTAVPNIAKPIIPDNYKSTISITHPIFWELIGLIEMLDTIMSEIEFLWLAGQLEDIHLENASGQAINAMRTLINRIYYVTNASNNRKGGLYSVSDFNELMDALTKSKNADDTEEDNESNTSLDTEEDNESNTSLDNEEIDDVTSKTSEVIPKQNVVTENLAVKNPESFVKAS